MLGHLHVAPRRPAVSVEARLAEGVRPRVLGRLRARGVAAAHEGFRGPSAITKEELAQLREAFQVCEARFTSPTWVLALRLLDGYQAAEEALARFRRISENAQQRMEETLSELRNAHRVIAILVSALGGKAAITEEQLLDINRETRLETWRDAATQTLQIRVRRSPWK